MRRALCSGLRLGVRAQAQMQTETRGLAALSSIWEHNLPSCSSAGRPASLHHLTREAEHKATPSSSGRSKRCTAATVLLG